MWLSVDPLAHETLEPYVFTGNNPVMMIDPDGRDWYKSEDGGLLWADDTIESIQLASKVNNSTGEIVDFPKNVFPPKKSYDEK